MRTVCLSHHTSDGIVYQYDKPTPWGYQRSMIILYAAPTVTHRDIIEEFYSKQDGQALETVTVLDDRRVISMTVAGFRNIAERMCKQGYGIANGRDFHFYSFEAALKSLAKEMIQSRDFHANGGYEKRSHTLKQYWPFDD